MLRNVRLANLRLRSAEGGKAAQGCPSSEIVRALRGDHLRAARVVHQARGAPAPDTAAPSATAAPAAAAERVRVRGRGRGRGRGRVSEP